MLQRDKYMRIKGKDDEWDIQDEDIILHKIYADKSAFLQDKYEDFKASESVDDITSRKFDEAIKIARKS